MLHFFSEKFVKINSLILLNKVKSNNNHNRNFVSCDVLFMFYSLFPCSAGGKGEQQRLDYYWVSPHKSTTINNKKPKFIYIKL